MAVKRSRPFLPAEVYSNPDVMGGMPCVRGTRVPAETIVAYLRDGYSKREIFEDYPYLPFDAIEAVKAWAEKEGITILPGGANNSVAAPNSSLAAGAFAAWRPLSLNWERNASSCL
jgi:uncharacterized protein (DUF433 family)